MSSPIPSSIAFCIPQRRKSMTLDCGYVIILTWTCLSTHGSRSGVQETPFLPSTPTDSMVQPFCAKTLGSACAHLFAAQITIFPVSARWFTSCAITFRNPCFHTPTPRERDYVRHFIQRNKTFPMWLISLLPSRIDLFLRLRHLRNLMSSRSCVL